MNKWLTATALGISLALGGCFHINDTEEHDHDDDHHAAAVKLSGIIYVPSGGKFEKISALGSIFNNVFGKPLYAALTGTTHLGAGTTIKLIDTTKTGDEAIIAETVSIEDGAYTLEAPEGFVAGPQYVVRAEGSDGQTIESRIMSEPSETGDYTVEVDPLTHAASELVNTIASDANKISELSVEELLLILEEIQNALKETETDVTTLTSVASIAAELKAATLNNDETANVLYSSASSGKICGTVTGANGQGLYNVAIVARDYRDWVTRAKTKTGADGKYCLNVPVAEESINGETHNGEYIIGAINRNGSTNDPDKHASEWWTAGGGKPLQWEGDKISLTTTNNSITKDFTLALGARIKGTVVDPDGNALEGISVVIRDYETWFPLYASATKSDGSFKMNVPAGDYIVVARNQTRAPYATQVFADVDNNGVSDGVSVREKAQKIAVGVGDGKNLPFNMTAGVLVYGEVLDDIDGNPMTGIRVRFDQDNELVAGFTTALRTNKLGKYKVWMPPQNYSVRSRGQKTSIDLSNSANLTGTNNNKYSLNFTDPVTHVQTKLLRDGNPVSQAVALLRDVSTYDVVSQEISATDGIVDVYIADTSKSHILEIKVKEGESGAGQMIYVDQTSSANAYTIVRTEGKTITTGESIPTSINMPAGYKVSGSLTRDGSLEAQGTVVIRAHNGSTYVNFTKESTRGDGGYAAYLAAGSYKLIPKDSDDTPYVSDAVNITVDTQELTQDFTVTTP